MHIVITGTSKGLGLALAQYFCNRGHLVSGCSRSPSNLGISHDNYHHTEIDITDPKACMLWAEKCALPDILINNASIINKRAPLWELPAEEFVKVMEINVTGAFHILQSFLPMMVAKNHGVIINMSSGWGRSPEGTLIPYVASKYAIEGLTQSLAEELPSQMTAASLDPGGGIKTDMLASCSPDYHKIAISPENWVETAGPYILQITRKDNGACLTCPQAH